jgi:hypothetical protein
MPPYSFGALSARFWGLRIPKNRGPDQITPVIRRAIRLNEL